MATMNHFLTSDQDERHDQQKACPHKEQSTLLHPSSRARRAGPAVLKFPL
jgi:hypothetical protein